MKKKTFVLNGRILSAIDYKDVDYLRRFLNSQGKIYPPKRYGIPVRRQRQITQAIKRARHMGLLPFVIK